MEVLSVVVFSVNLQLKKESLTNSLGDEDFAAAAEEGSEPLSLAERLGGGIKAEPKGG